MKNISFNDIKELNLIIHPTYNILDMWRVKENGKTRIWLKIICDKGHVYNVLYDNYKKCGCHECRKTYMSIKNRIYSFEEIEAQCNKKNLKWINKDEVQNNLNRKNVFILECIKCGHILKCNITHLFSDRKCGNCSNNIKKPIERVKDELKSVYNDEYELFGEYNGSREQNIFIHNKCGNTFNSSLYNLLNGRSSCPYCQNNTSIGETQINSYLGNNNNNNIYYEPHYWFSDCRNINPLPFDFVIFNNIKKEAIKLIIEFDGRQHYEPVDRFGGLKCYLQTKINDTIKNNYCLQNKIRLLRIPFWEFKNINKILDKEFGVKEK